MIEPLKIDSSHEELFADRYHRLLAWSLQLSGNERELAEDLVHDAFVQFTLAQPDLATIRNLDSYLYGMLRHLHLSQIRRQTHTRLQQLSAVEYDSAEDGLRTTDLRDVLQMQDELRQVCNYACARKESARAASVLILRFFHGYYPSEIAQLLRTSRQAIDVRLLLARREARLSITNPGALSFVVARQLPEVLPAAVARTTDDFLNELRAMIFHSNRGECLSRRQLNNLYSVAQGDPMECGQLAHLVSCPSCLDEVNRMLGLPLLKERIPTETLGRDKRPKGPGGGGPQGGGAGFGNWRKRVRRVFEHKPQELCVAVNGYVQASQTVNSELSELNLNVDLAEDISFVEVFSEQKLRLLLLSVDELPPLGPGKRDQLLQMSDERTLSVSLEFRAPWPTVHVAYRDPTYREVQEILDSVASEEESLPVVRTSSAVNGPAPVMVHDPLTLRRLLERLLDRSFWFRPGTITAVVALMMIAAVVITQLRMSRPALTAATVLQQASVAEQAIAARTDTVFHRLINVEEYSNGMLLARHRIESWHSAEKGVTARRFFDDQNNLIAGEWSRADGRTVYHHGAKPQRRTNTPLLDFENAWQAELSVKEFAALVGSGQTSVEERSGSYVINYVNQTSATEEQTLVKATLVLTRAELHPTEQILVIRRDDETREYRFMETSFERHAPTTVAPAVFEPEPELVPVVTLGTRESKPEAESLLAVPSAPAPAIATAELEVEVLDLINQSGADLGDEVNVRRTSEGQLLVQGIVENDKRKEEILRALGPMSSNPAVKLRVQTTSEALREQEKSKSSSSRTATVERLESGSNKIPADADLRRYFSAMGVTGVQLDQSVNQYAARMVNRSLQVLRHAGAMERLAQRFSLEQLRTLDAEARIKWHRLLRAHAQSVERELAALRRDLDPMISGAPPGSTDGGKIDSDQDLQLAVHRLFEVCSATDQVVRSTFTVSVNGSNASTIKSAQFARSLSSAEALANSIEAAARP